MARRGDRVPDVHVFDAGDRDDVACRRLRDAHALQALEAPQRADLPLQHAVLADDGHHFLRLDRAISNAADRDAADVLVVDGVVHQELQGEGGVALGRGKALDQRFEERRQVARFVCELALGDPVFADRIDVREVGLLVGRPEVAEQIEHFVEGFVGTRVASIDLVDDRDDGQVELDALRQNEPCLGKGALGCIHQEQRAVGHAQRPLDLTTEVGVSGRVDEIDLVVFPANRCVLRQNRDAALTLEVVRIEHALAHGLIRPKDARLMQHRVHQGRLAVVDVGDNRHISNHILHVLNPHAFARGRVLADPRQGRQPPGFEERLPGR